MKHYAATASNAQGRLGPGRRAYAIDSKLSAFLLFDGLAEDKTNAEGVEKMTEAILGTLHTHSRVLRKFVDRPTFTNRIRTALILELGMIDAQREFFILRKIRKDTNAQVPRVCLLVFAGSQALAIHLGMHGLFLIRHGTMRRLASDPGRSPLDSGDTASYIDPTAALSKRPPSGSGSGSGSGRSGTGTTTGVNPNEQTAFGATAVPMEMIYSEIKPGDIFFMASIALDMSLVDHNAIATEAQAVKDIDQLLHLLAEEAVNDVSVDGVVTGIMVKALDYDNPRSEDLVDKIAMFRETRPFQLLSDDELLKVLKLMRLAEYEPGERLIVQGEKSDQLFVAVTGKFRIIRNGVMVNEVGPSSCFGEVSFMEDLPHSADVLVIEPARVVSLSRHDFRRINDADPLLGGRILWQICRVLSERLIQTTELLVKTATGQKSDAPDSNIGIVADASNPYVYRDTLAPKLPPKPNKPGKGLQGL